MKKAQAMQVLCALFEEEILGVADGETVSRTIHQGFIRACQIADPELQQSGYVAPWNKNAGNSR